MTIIFRHLLRFSVLLFPLLSPYSMRGADVGPNNLQPENRQKYPVVSDASNEGEQAIRRFRIPQGFKVDLFAAEPMLANPVAFTIDEKGRIFTSETYRYRSSVLDIRHYMAWLEDDMASRNNQDRLAMLKKYLGDKVSEMGLETEVIRLIEDTNGDGKADKSTVYADGFNDILDGIASGVLVRKGDVYFSNIPKLWKLRDQDGDGKADTRSALSDGYGVHYNYTGHDLHGLIVGHDGRLYFSIGDRGAHIKTREGRVLDFPDEGAVFRCELDGSNLEVFARGLRNPQELAFNQYGDLFTGDNDSDQGDRERWVYVVQGSDSGWRIGYQHNPLGNAGPWNFEKLWWPLHEGQPAYITPPLANIDNGPSGLVYNYGTGLPPQLDDHFFLCHFKGASSNSRITSYKLKRSGAAFALEQTTEFLGDVLPTDVEIGPDGAMYFSDWHQGWPKSSKGRIYKISHAIAQQDPAVLETRRLLADGLKDRTPPELGQLLGHKDMRVRLEAQWALAQSADSSATQTLIEASQQGPSLLARLHGIWGLGQKGRINPSILRPHIALLSDPHPEIRAQTAKILGESNSKTFSRSIVPLLDDSDLRVQLFAMMALSKVGDSGTAKAVQNSIRNHGNKDPFLRHASALALARVASPATLLQAAKDNSVALRMSSLLAMRHSARPEISRFLKDPEPSLVEEAARAINDVPIPQAYPALAALAETSSVSTLSLGYRVANANYRLGTQQSATRLAKYASNPSAPVATRTEAVKELALWATPFARDRVVGTYRPLPPRDKKSAVVALESELNNLLRQSNETLLITTIEACATLEIKSSISLLTEILSNPVSPAKARASALRALADLRAPTLTASLARAFDDQEEEVRREAIRQQSKIQSTEAFPNLKKALARGSSNEIQDALIALSTLPNQEVDDILKSYLESLLNNQAANAIRLDILEAVSKRSNQDLKSKLEKYRSSSPQELPQANVHDLIDGGDRDAGKKVFFERQEVACFRCHQVDGQGGEVGPSLTGIGGRQTSTQILESIVYPNKAIANGFENVMITLHDGREYAGIVKSEDSTQLVLNSPEDGMLTLKPSEIKHRQKGLSGMPEELGKNLSARDLRNLVAFLAGLK